MPAERGAVSAAPSRRGAGARGRWWRTARRVATVLFVVAVAVLLVQGARRVDWAAVGETLREADPWRLAGAAALGFVSHVLYSSFDLVGRHLTGHHLPKARVLAVAWVCFVFNLNFGALVGGVALRLRLYTRLGLPAATAVRITAASMATNWLGYAVLAGAAFTLHPLPLPANWTPGSLGLRAAGVVSLAVAAAYFLACATRGRHGVWRWRGRSFRPPPLPIAALQVVLAAANWLLMAAILALLLPAALDYTSVLVVMLIAAVAGTLAHVPAGLGVLEAVFVGLLAGRVEAAGLLAGLLAYRGLYYLVPLLAALPLFLALDSRSRWPRA